MWINSQGKNIILVKTKAPAYKCISHIYWSFLLEATMRLELMIKVLQTIDINLFKK